MVYVAADSTLRSMPQGVSCTSCDSPSGVNLVGTVTDGTGQFSIRNAPAGENVPLVVEIGKWRKLYMIDVASCEDNLLPDHSLRMPRNHMEGDLPDIAISTGADDSLECLPLRMGIDPTEYVAGASGSGRIHVFTGPGGASTAPMEAGPPPDPATSLWDSDGDIDSYDVVLLSCEGAETANMNQDVMWDYVNGGGRVFATHFHYAWFNTGPFAGITPAIASWTAGAQPVGDISGNISAAMYFQGQSSLEGPAFAPWLAAVGGLSGGELPIVDAFDNASVAASNTNTRLWAFEQRNASAADDASVGGDADAPQPAALLSFNLPQDPPPPPPVLDCGRVVFSDFHVGAGTPALSDYTSDAGSSEGGRRIVPAGCATRPLTPQEEARRKPSNSCCSTIRAASSPPADESAQERHFRDSAHAIRKTSPRLRWERSTPGARGCPSLEPAGA
jgi:hypothetical protein